MDTLRKIREAAIMTAMYESGRDAARKKATMRPAHLTPEELKEFERGYRSFIAETTGAPARDPSDELV